MRAVTPPTSLHDALGGEVFERLVAGFYARVRTDDILGPMYPQDDWEGAEERLRMFLVQYWGGPSDYQAQRGHPRLRMRHMPFTIDATAAQRWLDLMGASLDEIDEETLPPCLSARHLGPHDAGGPHAH
ncbi:Group 2 truncated hemoglobin GlbO [Corynebacterium lowii]|uniref:Group 2 truncated hemoglobin GlbO n=1 Tax=Corynebacterium lowii TaxID=1544413 RepID=A0A0N8VZT3_9CORY|nr:Group 2 truncated hemoglobin GlbO [Corynebacterium lowii]MDP9851681.1 hemoglobin [Corynebacterium lowii]